MARLIVGIFAACITMLAALSGTWRHSGTIAASSLPVPATAQLLVGFGSRDITPEVGKDKAPVYIAGFGHNRVADGVNDPLYVHAIVLDDGTSRIAMVTVDVVGLFYDDLLPIRQAFPTYAGVVVSSTHNHEGPDTLGLWGPTPIKNGINRDYLKHVISQAIAAVKEAEQKMVPATARFGKTPAPKMLHDSREPYILHDELYTLQFNSPDGKSLAILVNWHCHPETLADKNTKISADYVGYCRDILKKEYGCPVAYFTGTVGGLMTTLHLPVRDDQGTLMPENSLAKTIEYGRQLAKVAKQSMKASVPVSLTPLSMASQVIYLPLANPAFRMGRTMGILDRDAYQWKGDPFKPGDKVPSRTVAGEIALISEVSLLTLGDVQVACIPGEIYPEIVLGGVTNPADPAADFPNAPIEPIVYQSMKARHKMLFGLANDEVGYILPKRQWDEKPPYCYGRTKGQYGEVNSCGPETGPIICEALRLLAK